MMHVATAVVGTAGGIVFTTEFLAAHKLDWKVPLATLLLMPAIEGLADLDSRAAAFLAFIIFAGAATTKFNGVSVSDEINKMLKGTGTVLQAPASTKQTKVNK